MVTRGGDGVEVGKGDDAEEWKLGVGQAATSRHQQRSSSKASLHHLHHQHNLNYNYQLLMPYSSLGIAFSLMLQLRILSVLWLAPRNSAIVMHHSVANLTVGGKRCLSVLVCELTSGRSGPM